MRRGSVPMEEEERQRKGDVYREMKVGAVFLAERGPERSELAPEVWVETPKEGSLRYFARRTAKGGFGQLLYALAVQSGLSRAKQIVVLGDGAPWIWKLVAEHFPGAVQIVDLYHAQRMRYPAFRAQGLHVGSGIAEAACKTVVETRAKRAGMWWTPEGLDALLPLRTAKLNHTKDEFWEQQSRLVA